LPHIKQLFYDNSYKDRSPNQKFINNLDKLRQYGESISDQQLEEARKSVKPNHVLHHFFFGASYKNITLHFNLDLFAGYLFNIALKNKKSKILLSLVFKNDKSCISKEIFQ